MKRPDDMTMLVGHPVVGLPLIGFGLFTIYLCYLHPDAWPLGLVALFGLAGVANAAERAAKYREWKQAWDSMAPQAPAKRSIPLPGRRLIAGGIVVAAVGYAVTHLHGDPLMVLALGWLLIGGTIFGLVLLVRRLLGKAAAKRGALVAIVIRRPVLKVPPLWWARRKLPPHCRAILR